MTTASGQAVKAVTQCQHYTTLHSTTQHTPAWMGWTVGQRDSGTDGQDEKDETCEMSAEQNFARTLNIFI